MMTDHRRTVRAAGPVTAGHVFAARERAAIGLGAGEDIVHVRLIAAGVDHVAFSLSAVSLLILLLSLCKSLTSFAITTLWRFAMGLCRCDHAH